MPPARMKWALTFSFSCKRLLLFVIVVVYTLCCGNVWATNATHQLDMRLTESDAEISICLLLIVRDEEESLGANLPLWRNIASCYVIGVDDRTTDSTVEVILEVLPEDKSRFIFFYKFEDFGQARNAVLRVATRHFPDVSHILFADADWRPDLATVDLSEVDLIHASFQIMLWDHSGHTTRLAKPLLRNDSRLRFKYRVHEILDPTALEMDPSKTIGWEIRVVESDSSWHAEQHGHSRAAERFAFDLKLLELDYRDDPSDMRTLFYLGITTYSYMESLVGKGKHETTSELAALTTDGMFYFRRLIDLHLGQPGTQFVWGALRWLAYGYQYFTSEVEEAERWYLECIAYDPTRVDCTISISRLFLDNGDFDAAWEAAKEGLLHRPQVKHVLDYFYMYECFVPIQAAAVISKRVDAAMLGSDSLEAVLTLGSYLMRHHTNHCNHGVLVDSVEDIRELHSWFDNAADREGLDVEATKRVALLTKEPTVLKVLLETWGTGKPAASYAHVMSLPTEQTSDVNESADGRTAHVGAAELGRQELEQRCARIVNDTLALMEFQNRSGELELRPREPISGVMAATDLSQIIMAKKYISPAVDVGEGQTADSFRALIVGNAGGLDDEMFAHLLSLLVQLSAVAGSFEITYVHPDGRSLAAARSLVNGCPDELVRGIDKLHFVRATFDEFLNADTNNAEPFDYVDIGEPLSNFAADGKDLKATVNVDTLRLLSTKLRKRRACVRVWSFAASPVADLMFRARHAYRKLPTVPRTIANNSQQIVGIPVNPAAEEALAKILRTRYGLGAGQSDVVNESPEDNEGFRTGNEEAEWLDPTAPPPASAQHLPREEQIWAKQVLATVAPAGDALMTVTDIDAVLSQARFKTAQLLGDVQRYEPGAMSDGLRDLSDVKVILEGMSQWEVATLADSLAPVPVLVHQVLAVWRDESDFVAAIF